MSEPIKAERNFPLSEIARVLLDEAHQTQPPTNAERVARTLGLQVKGFFPKQYNLSEKVRAYLHPAKKEIGFSRELSRNRRNFSILHEIGHYVLPGHLPNDKERILDDDLSLKDTFVIRLEMEANEFASHCLFQVDSLKKDVKNLELTWRNIEDISEIYNASLEATARRWVEYSDKDYALIVFTPIERQSESPLRVKYTITSESFAHKYFGYFPKNMLLDENSKIFKIFHRIDYEPEPIIKLHIQLSEENVQEFNIKLFSNYYNMLGLIEVD